MCVCMRACVCIFFLLVNSNTYYNIHENNNSVLNQIYNTLHNQSTTTKWPNFCNCRLWL